MRMKECRHALQHVWPHEEESAKGHHRNEEKDENVFPPRACREEHSTASRGGDEEGAGIWLEDKDAARKAGHHDERYEAVLELMEMRLRRRKPCRQIENVGDFQEFGWLDLYRADADPSPRAIDGKSDMRDED